ncbi:MAG: M15 family metallopeptidase [Clostridia bacterium]|nr:M15 family metallopeptidase [Clostridia bacterium]
MEQPTLPQEPQHEYETAVYVYQSNVDEDVLLTGLDQTYLLLANKIYILGSDYEPASLSTLTCATNGGKTVELETRTAQALYEMLQEMEADGVSDLAVTSGYRSYSYQVSLNNYYLNLEASGISADAYRHFGAAYIKTNYTDKGLSALSAKDAEAVVRSYSAEPGKSEHQTGLCIDFVTSTAGLTEAFENTEAFAWLSENAYKFGFILRYPKGKEGVTGYTYEPWHYRFVGREAATDIYYRGLTLEEYLGASQT